MDTFAQYSRQYRRPYERSISERRFEEHRFPSQCHHLNLRKENSNSYHQGNFLLIIALSLISRARLTHVPPLAVRFITLRDSGKRKTERFASCCAAEARIKWNGA